MDYVFSYISFTIVLGAKSPCDSKTRSKCPQRTPARSLLISQRAMRSTKKTDSAKLAVATHANRHSYFVTLLSSSFRSGS